MRIYYHSFQTLLWLMTSKWEFITFNFVLVSVITTIPFIPWATILLLKNWTLLFFFFFSCSCFIIDLNLYSLIILKFHVSYIQLFFVQSNSISNNSPPQMPIKYSSFAFRRIFSVISSNLRWFLTLAQAISLLLIMDSFFFIAWSSSVAICWCFQCGRACSLPPYIIF